MSGDDIFVDTNVLIYCMDGRAGFDTILNGKRVFISIISEIEILASGKYAVENDSLVRDFLSDCLIIDLVDDVKEKTIEYRRKYKLKLPDAVIAATASFLQIPIITADIAFRRIDDLQVILVKP